jgi:hypothetical protein
MKLVDPVLYIKLAASGKLPTPQSLALAIMSCYRMTITRLMIWFVWFSLTPHLRANC